MTEKELLEIIESWENIEVTIREIGNHSEHFDTLMQLALYSDDPKSWRASYIVDKIHENFPDIVVPYIEQITEQLKKETHPSKKRHLLRQISLHPIGEKHFVFLVDYCLNTLSSAKEAPAVRVHAMQILYNISEIEQDLKPELLAVIEQEMEYHATAGIISRGSKLAMKLRQQIRLLSPDSF